MTIDRVREFYNARPFQAFVVHFAAGREVAVHHPEYLAAAPSGRTVTVHQPDDSLHVVHLPLVTDLEIKPTAGRPGPRRKR